MTARVPDEAIGVVKPKTNLPRRKRAGKKVTSTTDVPAPVVPPSPGGGEEGHSHNAKPKRPCHPAIAELRELFCQWRAVVRSQIRIDNATLAMIRRAIGYESRMDEKARKIVAKKAMVLKKLIEDNDPIPDELAKAGASMRSFVNCSSASRLPFDAMRSRIEDRMEEIGGELPGAAFARSVRGFGVRQLSKIIGITGDLNLYANPGKVWRRLCLAPFHHGGTNKAGSTWRREGGLSAEEWTEFGYNPETSAMMFTIGDVLIKTNAGEYKKLYDDRKAYEIARDSESEGMKAHRRAQRYMTKRLILNLWKEWRAMTAV